MDKKIISLISLSLLVSLISSGCGNVVESENTSNTPSTNTTVSTTSKSVEKPAKITMMVDGTLVDQENGRDTFEAQWEALTGIDLEIIQPGHDIYYDEVKKSFDSGDLPDVVLLNSTYYTSYAAEYMLADITSYYEGSDLQKRIAANGTESLIDGIKLNGKLYGITPTRGNGCVTYIKKKWLDNVNLEPPANYEEYLNMLKAFSEGDPDGNGIDGDTYGVSAAGIISNEAPYTNYLPEFYQDAYPSFYRTSEGKWADGFTDDSMKAALERLREAYQNGYIDEAISENSTSNCRDKFYANEFGVFTYWAGTWAKTLSDKLIDAGVDGELVAIPPIAETGNYLERVAPVWCITSRCKNPAGVYKYFIETMLDGGEMEYLWTFKPEVDDYSKNHIDHMLAIVPLENNPGSSKVTENQADALKIFNENSIMADLVTATEAYTLYSDKLWELKKELVKKVVVDGEDIDTAYSEFDSSGGTYMSDAIVISLNAE